MKKNFTMKKILLCCFCFYFSYFFTKPIYKSNDPFDAINSTIPFINNRNNFLSKIEQSEIIVFFSYQNSFYGNEVDTFTKMAKIYTEIGTIFSHNKQLKFYRSYMLSGISSLLIAEKSPAMIVFYQGIPILICAGEVTKDNLVNAILKTIKNIN